jgi:hypothetical protein
LPYPTMSRGYAAAFDFVRVFVFMVVLHLGKQPQITANSI